VFEEKHIVIKNTSTTKTAKIKKNTNKEQQHVFQEKQTT